MEKYHVSVFAYARGLECKGTIIFGNVQKKIASLMKSERERSV